MSAPLLANKASSLLLPSKGSLPFGLETAVTVTCCGEFELAGVKVKLLAETVPSPTFVVVNPEIGLTVKPAWSSLVIVVVAVAVVIVGVEFNPEGFDNVTLMVSLGSIATSPKTSRVMVF